MALPRGRCSKTQEQPSCLGPVHNFRCSAPSVGMQVLCFATPRGCGAHLLSVPPLARVSGASHFATSPLREVYGCSRCLQNQRRAKLFARIDAYDDSSCTCRCCCTVPSCVTMRSLSVRAPSTRAALLQCVAVLARMLWPTGRCRDRAASTYARARWMVYSRVLGRGGWEPAPGVESPAPPGLDWINTGLAGMCFARPEQTC